MTVPQLTPELITEIFKREKPHLVLLETEARKMEFGTLQVNITVRAGEVEKMEITRTIAWLRERDKSKNLQGE